jgi:glyoxylase-like metal-dependent hydrolase (beta-lactamase superfamily II)
MHARLFLAAVSLAFLGVAVWLRGAGADAPARWTLIAPDVYRSPGPVAGYALVAHGEALLIDAPHPADGLPGGRAINSVLLTHYHRAVCREVESFQKHDKLNRTKPNLIRAPKQAKEWLSRDEVKKHWKESLPLRGSRTAYLVVPEGFDDIMYHLQAELIMNWRGWKLQVVEAPGHALAQIAVLAQKENGPRILFCGGALAAPGKLWAPYTTDWDHWTDLGLKPAGESLRRLAALKPDIVCPTYGPVIDKDATQALSKTAEVVDNNAFLKSFERFTKERLKNAPEYRFLAKEQAQSNGSKPWSRVSDSLWLTGNTYVLVSKDNACLMMDPWDQRSADQWLKLQKDHKLGPLEVVLFSHAHYDHYDGVYYLPERDSFQVWTLDLVGLPIARPFLLRAPFLDARPVRIDKTPRDGDTLAWREYRLTFRHLPGQSEFTMGVETVIDGKRCYFTADNFFHQDMFSGSGGWMGLNRSFPPLYAASARKVLDAAPDWVLAEHGGPFEFSAEDFRRRVQWGEVAAQAANELSPSGNHQHDWNPHQVRVEPLVQQARPGATLSWTVLADNRLDREQSWQVTLEGRAGLEAQEWQLSAAAGKIARRAFTTRLPEKMTPGRHVWTLRVLEGERLSAADAFLAVDIIP